MKDYRPEVEHLLEQNDCVRSRYIGNGVYLWHSPRSNRSISVDPVIPTKSWANDILERAGVGRMIK
jgi:hypothetical protein